MKRKYEAPAAEIIRPDENEDILTASGAQDALEDPYEDDRAWMLENIFS